MNLPPNHPAALAHRAVAAAAADVERLRGTPAYPGALTTLRLANRALIAAQAAYEAEAKAERNAAKALAYQERKKSLVARAIEDGDKIHKTRSSNPAWT